MSEQETVSRQHMWRFAFLAVLVLAGGGVLLSDALHGAASTLFDRLEPVLGNRPVLGAVAFVGLSAASAMLAFFSTSVVTPAAIDAWGQVVTTVLLWGGWLLGGLFSFSVGRWLGRPIVRRLAGAERIDRYEILLKSHSPFPVLVLFQLAVPSEIPGYVLGTLRYRVGQFLAALALAELPFAVGTVYLGELFLERRVAPFILVGTLGVVVSAGAFVYFHRIIRRQTSEGRKADDRQ